VARALGLSTEAVRRGLQTFAGSPDVNPGRGHLFEIGGVRVFVDFAHNPRGMRAIVDLMQAFPAKRRLIVLGQAGDRDDASIRDLVRAACALAPDQVIVKEMLSYLRGRAEGEIPALITTTLLDTGMPAARISQAPDEIAALRQALAWARPGDLVVIPVHASRDDVVQTVRALVQRGWNPGEPV